MARILPVYILLYTDYVLGRRLGQFHGMSKQLFLHPWYVQALVSQADEKKLDLGQNDENGHQGGWNPM